MKYDIEEFFMKDFPFENKLIDETSPYLLQHAHNPVNWYPWGEEAFVLAKEQNKPIFVSIGYSTCHWCHRMAHDCFEDAEVAALLNRDFISVKVDREERPDIDQIYMNVCQMLTGTGGWPLNVFVTPEQLPFYAGTYFPKYSRGKQPGMLDILTHIKDVYTNQADRVQHIGEGLKRGLVEQSLTVQVERSADLPNKAFKTLLHHFDGVNGGFGGAPKFPNIAQLQYLLKYGELNKKSEAHQLVEKTLDHLYKGGIYDHLGGGIARYATDKKWLVPHFEKMLYDQAQLLIIYAEGYQLFKKPIYKTIIEETVRFLQREMKGDNGSYYSAVDADSEGREGAYYLWDLEDVPSGLAEQYGIYGSPHLDGQYIFNLVDNDAFETVGERFKLAREELLELREKRIYPHVDQKQLTGWNALLVVGLAKASSAIQSEEVKQKAEELIQALENHHQKDGRLMMTSKSEAPAFLDDYSYMIWAYNELYEATQNQIYLAKSQQITAYVMVNFKDDNGGFTASSAFHEQLIVNQKSAIDGALPPGNSILAVELYRLSRLVDDAELETTAFNQLDVFSKDLMMYPTSTLSLLQLELFQLANGKDLKMFGDTLLLVEKLQQQFRPFDLWTTKKAEHFSLQICQQTSCLATITDLNNALDIISSK